MTVSDMAEPEIASVAMKKSDFLILTKLNEKSGRVGCLTGRGNTLLICKRHGIYPLKAGEDVNLRYFAVFLQVTSIHETRRIVSSEIPVRRTA